MTRLTGMRLCSAASCEGFPNAELRQFQGLRCRLLHHETRQIHLKLASSGTRGQCSWPPRCGSVALRSFHCQPSQPRVRIHFPASLRFRGCVPTSQTSLRSMRRNGLVGDPLPEHGGHELSVCQAPTRRSAWCCVTLTIQQEISSKWRTWRRRRTRRAPWRTRTSSVASTRGVTTTSLIIRYLRARHL